MIININTVIAWEIFSNPYDLHISIDKRKKKKRNSKEWGFLITRGPEGLFQPLCKLSAFATQATEAAQVVGEILGSIPDSIVSELGDPSSFLNQHLGVRAKGYNQLQTLWANRINHIVTELCERQIVYTCEMAFAD